MHYRFAILLALGSFTQAPDASAQPPADSQDATQFVLSSHVDGGFSLNGQRVPAGELRETLKRTFAGRSIRRLQLDLRVPIDSVSHIVLIRAATDFKIDMIVSPMRPQ